MRTIGPFLDVEQICQLLITGSHAIVRKLDGEIVWWPTAASTVYGWTSKEALGKSLHELLCTRFPNQLDVIDREFLSGGQWLGELVHQCKNERTIFVQSSWKLMSGKDGNKYVVEINNDITDLVRAREELARSEQRLKLAQEVAHLGVWDWDATTDSAVCSEEWFAHHGQQPRAGGLPFDEWLNWVHTDDRQRFATDFHMAQHEGEPFEGECRIVRPSGEVRWLQARAQPVFDSSGGCVRMLGVSLDITRQKDFEARLQHINQSLQHSNDDLHQFAFAAGHDLKEPLRAVAACSGMIALRLGEALDDDSRKYLKYMQDGASRMQTMIDGLLEYAKAAEEDLPVQRTSTNELARTALDNLQAAMAESEAEVVLDPLPEIEANPAALTQVFQNLIGNAFKYRRPEERLHIRISAARSGKEWVFCISDNGIGFDWKHREQIFQLFRRVGNTVAGGSGVGLATSRRAIERHGGRMWAESEPGVGSTFYFTLPVQHKEIEDVDVN